MTAATADEPDDGMELPDAPSPDPFPDPDSGCPPEFADWSPQELAARFDAEDQEHANRPEQDDVPESFPPGFLSRTAPAKSGSGFQSGGSLDASAPDGFLAGLTDAVTRDGHLTGQTDDELIWIMRAWQRLASWSNSGLLTAVAELARRRPAPKSPPAAPGQLPEQISEFTVDEVAHALTLTSRAADRLFAASLDLKTRLPVTAGAHHEGLLDQDRARLIAEMTRNLSDADAARVEAMIFPRATGQTTGQLRAALARAIIAVDPEAAARRREEAQKDPRVRQWQEDAGTMALAGYSLPPAEALAADQRLTGRAHALRVAGLPGTLEELRARAFLDALLDRDSTPAPHPPSPGPAGGSSDPARPGGPDEPSCPAADQRGQERTSPSSPDPALPIASRVTLTLPIDTGAGLSNAPGTVAGFGPVDGPLARQLLAAADTHPASRFCLTLIDKNGQAVGHTCLPGPHAWTRLTTQGLTVSITPLARGSCDHRHQEPGYHPSRKLAHLIQARNRTCSARGCQHPAARCDLDHTKPYDQGGRSCECGLAPLCRHHHRCKQSEGWQLEQPEPGVLAWTTPAGRHYITRPDTYP